VKEFIHYFCVGNMSKVVEYVGFFHALKDRLKESWTQYWLSDSSGGNTGGSGGDGFADDRETNFRIKVKEKLERLKHQTIRKIDRSSSLDEDFSHLTRFVYFLSNSLMWSYCIIIPPYWVFCWCTLIYSHSLYS